ncbi:uncharacterized protein MYCGRDRAFT_106716 [Zymoseptoria tritici IPO323]|uniref:Uncharacterized protein n=1 Tax=Zymoseptoria tritici (strain CBS 115943 / IPO323) TaxID=336722 RepID=F9XSB6_ZYMTI|nr:uncharacterized protein MYCGRDRAFT_106716 [Zymoseptoria tritici IPO323]EGP81839.1 hypothetical protein MYCGRDRAFT_106716 [Zymoseptoria tritici IPO323]
MKNDTHTGTEYSSDQPSSHDQKRHLTSPVSHDNHAGAVHHCKPPSHYAHRPHALTSSRTIHALMEYPRRDLDYLHPEIETLWQVFGTYTHTTPSEHG